jgi:hypothetical protein
VSFVFLACLLRERKSQQPRTAPACRAGQLIGDAGKSPRDATIWQAGDAWSKQMTLRG